MKMNETLMVAREFEEAVENLRNYTCQVIFSCNSQSSKFGLLSDMLLIKSTCNKYLFLIYRGVKQYFHTPQECLELLVEIF